MEFKLYNIGNIEMHEKLLEFLKSKDKDVEFVITSDTNTKQPTFIENKVCLIFNKLRKLTRNLYMVKCFNGERISGLIGIKKLENAIRNNLDYDKCD